MLCLGFTHERADFTGARALGTSMTRASRFIIIIIIIIIIVIGSQSKARGSLESVSRCTTIVAAVYPTCIYTRKLTALLIPRKLPSNSTCPSFAVFLHPRLCSITETRPRHYSLSVYINSYRKCRVLVSNISLYSYGTCHVFYTAYISSCTWWVHTCGVSLIRRCDLYRK